MQTLVIYDIPDDRTRNRLAEACKDYGLTRIQFSGFMGALSHHRREELEGRLRQTMGTQVGKIHIFPLCDKDLKLRREIVVAGKGPTGGRKRGKHPGAITEVDDEATSGRATQA